MVQYALNTTVSSDKSRNEIERTLARYGADEFAYGWDRGQAAIGFAMENRKVKFLLPLPNRDADEFRLTPTGKNRKQAQQEAEYEKAVRQRWRALALVVKAKLEAVAAGITVFEDEFMAHIVLPGGETVSDFMKPQIEQAYLTGKMPKLLEMGKGN